VIDEQGRVTEYVYDAAGNILQVIVSGAGSAQPPSVTGYSPTSVRRGETVSFQINGTNLTGARVSTADPGLDISGLQASATQITFSLAVLAGAALGTHAINISNAGGGASVQLTVNPVLPKLGMSPLPIAVPPTGAARSFFVTLSSPDSIAHVVTLASSNPSIVTVSPTSVTFAAGETEKLVGVTGHAPGNAAINVSAPGLAPTSVPVFVTADFTGITTSRAPLVGVVRETAPSQTSTTFTPIASPRLGVAVGSYIQGVTPNRLAIGTGPTEVVISGNELGGVTAVAISPPDGVTIGTPSVAPDGRSVTVAVTVAANAPATLRTLRLSGAQQPYVAARPGADQLRITLPPPQIDSVDPNFAVAGTTAMTLTIRGRNLQAAQRVDLTPSTGIAVSSTPSVNSDGTVLTLAVSVSPLAPTGPRVVTVTTVGGTSDAAATPANTFSVVNEVQAAYTPIVAAQVGVVKQDASTPPSQTLSAYSAHVGVVIPPAATGISPAVGIIGQMVTLTVNGVGLGGVTAIQLAPSDGVTVGAPSVNADGTAVAVTLDIASDAPQSLRTVKVLAGSTQIAFTNANAALFRVSAPLPEIDAISPIVLQVGAPAVSLTVFGRNFQNASQVRVDPPGGVTISPPTVNASGTQASVTVSAAAGSATGPRTVIVTTPPGESATTQSPANTLTLVNTIQANYAPISAPVVGVVLQSAATVSTSFGPFISPLVGLVLQSEAQPPATIQRSTFGTALGVVTGSYASSVQATPLTPTSSGTLTISGAGLADATAVLISPPDGITVGALTIAPDGTQISAPITLAAAAAGPRTVVVQRGTERVSFVPAGGDVFRVAPGVPNIDSISPILNSRGQTFTMIIRGQNLQNARVTATPGTGLFIDSAPSVNGAGTEITLRVGIAADAPLGSHVFRVFTPGGATTDEAVPANTFTVLE